MNKIIKTAACVLSLCCVFSLSAQVSFANVQAQEKAMQHTINADSKAGKQVKQWHETQDDLINELRQIKIETQWLELQKQKYTSYVENNGRKIREIRETNSRYAVISLQLESVMNAYLEELRIAIENDIPFLMEERQNRLVFLRDSLSNSNLSIGEKFRRFAEALNVEAAYGSDTEVAFHVADFEGKQTELIAVRLGRVGYYALTLDLKQSGIWNKETKSFDKTNEQEHEMILALHDTINSKHFVELIPVPMRGANYAN